MDLLTALDADTDYTPRQLQLLVGGWVLSSGLIRGKIAIDDGDVSEDDYDKRSIYSLLYALYRTMGTVPDEHGTHYEFTFNTWGYAWPEGWGEPPNSDRDPQRFGKNAYTGLYARDAVRDYVAERGGKVHVVEMGCGTGAGAHHVCKNVLPDCTYEAIDMQQAAIRTCKRKFESELRGRLRPRHGDATKLAIPPKSADLLAVCETHVTEYPGVVTDEDRRFFAQAHSTLKPGGYMVWGNAIPDVTWDPCFEALEDIGLKLVEAHDVTEEAIKARDDDEARLNTYVENLLERFYAFRMPLLGPRQRAVAEVALKNFSRHPGTRLYNNMTTREDTYKVVLLQKPS